MDARPSTADVYREVRAGAAFQELRGRHRRFVVPACALFLTWYLAHVVAATTAPALMARPLPRTGQRRAGRGARPVRQHLPADLGVRTPGRLRRDRLALDLRWETQQLTRKARG